MKRLSAMQAKAQIHIVTISAVSIDPQLDASGVIHHGLSQWNRIEPTTRSAIATATPMPLPNLQSFADRKSLVWFNRSLREPKQQRGEAYRGMRSVGSRSISLDLHDESSGESSAWLR